MMYRFPVLSLRRSKSALFALPSVAGGLTLILYQPLFSACMVSWALFGLSLTLNLSGKSMVTLLFHGILVFKYIVVFAVDDGK